MSDPTMRLNTFLISHFSEKARWAMKLLGVPFAERRLLIGPHVLTTRKLAKKSSVPILEHANGNVQGSAEILDYLAQELKHTGLEPDPEHAAESRALEDRVGIAFGRGVQCITYDVLLQDRAAVIRLYSLQGPFWAPAFYRLAFSRMVGVIRKMYGITPPAVLESKQRLRDMVNELDGKLAGKRYFYGDRPTRLDLTSAALIAPFYRPAEHPVPWPPLPAELAAFAAEFESSATVQHMRRMYAEHRSPR